MKIQKLYKRIFLIPLNKYVLNTYYFFRHCENTMLIKIMDTITTFRELVM